MTATLPPLVSDGIRLVSHLARPPLSGARSSQPGLVLCHGLPVGEASAGTAGHTFPQLADRIAADTGWTCLSFCLRGAGESEGEFSIAGWVADLKSAVAYLRQAGFENVWLAGFSTGGTLAVRVAADDPSIRGVATLSAPSDLSAWANDPAYLLDLVRQVGLIHPASQPDLAEWAREVASLNPLEAAAEIPPRPFFVVHGSADDVVSVVDARALADATEGQAELHLIPMAGHRLRHDPRAIAILLGWLERQTTN